MFSNQKIRKTYFAIVQNKKEIKNSGTIDSPIFDKDKKLEAQTNYKVEKRISNNLSFIKLNPKTGRKHQLRIHCLEENFPILGDRKYYSKNIQNKIREKKLFLHAGEIEFIDSEKNLVKFKADLPDHFQKYLKKFHSILIFFCYYKAMSNIIEQLEKKRQEAREGGGKKRVDAQHARES